MTVLHPADPITEPVYLERPTLQIYFPAYPTAQTQSRVVDRPRTHRYPTSRRPWRRF